MVFRAGRCRRGRRALASISCALLAAAASAEVPAENACPTVSGASGAGAARDAAPLQIRAGARLDYQAVLRLGSLFPIEIWRNRDAFFHEGMELEIGPCHRRYPVPDFFAEATRRFAGRAVLDGDGNLRDYVAGLPFPPETIDANAPDAGLRWAWNLLHRYRGAGPVGSFRIVDMPSRAGGIQTYRGTWFFLQTGHRADLAASDYAIDFAERSAWIAGGRFEEPTPARHLAWKQLRPLAAAGRYDMPDDTFVYVPAMRKVRRASTTWVDGLYVPRYRISGGGSGGGLAGGGGDFGPGAGISPGAAESIAVTENLRRGFEGLTLRPNAYRWRVLGEREVLAPLNVTRSGYPDDPDRNFGPSGLSVGSDRWDVRYAVVIQGALMDRGHDYDLLTLYIDHQTQQPLYVITKRRSGGRLLEVGVMLHRFSGDLPRYPLWPDGEKANVFDPVAAVFHDAADGGSGWRRESYDLRSVPLDDSEIRRLTSPGFLTRGR